jgi:thiosulfate/3-mercaptopyruvate sulfurtransferase
MLNKSGRIFILFFLILLFPGSDALSQVSKNETDKPILVTCEWLKENISDPDLVILHISALLRNYENGHIEGSRFLYPGWLSVSSENESTVPAGKKQIRRTLERAGVTGKSHIVLYGTAGNLVPVSRVFVTLSHYGLGGRLSILQGGFEEWMDSGGKVSVDLPTVKRGRLQLKEQNILVDAEWMVRNMESKDYFVIDVRPRASYDGVGGSSRQGHIPGAVHLPATSLYDANTWQFVSGEKIKEIFDELPLSKEIRPVFYCNTGNSACINFVAAVVAGFNPILYDGSMEDWSSRLDLPVEN